MGEGTVGAGVGGRRRGVLSHLVPESSVFENVEVLQWVEWRKRRPTDPQQ